MSNPFMTLAHCARYATRHAYRTGDVAHVVATGHPEMPLTVIDEHRLFELSDRLSPFDVLFSADPFAEAEVG